MKHEIHYFIDQSVLRSVWEIERGGFKNNRERMRKLLQAGTGTELMEPEEQEEQQNKDQ